MDRSDIYRADPRILSGTPVFSGTRVPVKGLIDHLAAGDTLDDFLEGFPTVRRDQAVAFLRIALDEALAATPREAPV